jgi:predicted Zn-dependent protease
MNISAKTPKPVGLECILPVAVVVVACGCAQLNSATRHPEDLSVQRQERQQKIVDSFQRRRDETQYRASLACWERGDVDRCEAQLIDLLERNPDHFEARLALADLCLEQRKTRAAEQQYRGLIERHPHHAQSHYSYGLFLDVVGRTDEAGEHFRRAAEIEPENSTYVTLAVSTANPKAAAAAAPSKSFPPAAGPDSPDLAVVTTAKLLQAGKFDSALQLASAASAKYPDDVRLKHALASAQFESGDLKAAQVTLQQALSLDIRNALTYFLLGYTLKAQGDEQAAERHFAKARRLEPRLSSQG